MFFKKTRLISIVVLAVAAVLALLSFIPVALAEDTDAEIISIFSIPGIDISASLTGAETKVDTTVYLFEDGSFLQYLANEAEDILLSSGHFDKIGEFDLEKPLTGILTIDKVYQGSSEYLDLGLTTGVSFSDLKDYCLHLTGKDPGLVAAFTRASAQKLIRSDGTEEYLTTTWLYYEDGTFKQFAAVDGEGEVLFSGGDYLINGDFDDPSSILTLHRTQKYQDGVGLAAYDSVHDYVIGELDFLRVFPNPAE